MTTIKRHWSAVLAELAKRRALIPASVSVVMTAIDIDQSNELLALLTEHRNTIVVEPAIVALRMVSCETPLVAKEIRDIAFVIIMRHGATSGMLWPK